MSTRRHRTSMKMAAPCTESEMRRSLARLDGPSQRCRERRREVMVFLGSGASFAALAALLSENPAAWPIALGFGVLLLIYSAAIVESDRRSYASRMSARRQSRRLSVELPPEIDPASEKEYAEAV